MIRHRQDSVQALQEQERLAAQKDRLAEQSVEAARAFAAKTETLSDGEAPSRCPIFSPCGRMCSPRERSSRRERCCATGRRSTASCRRAVWYRRNTSRRTRGDACRIPSDRGSRTRGPRTTPSRGSTGWTAMPGSISAMKAMCTASRGRGYDSLHLGSRYGGTVAVGAGGMRRRSDGQDGGNALREKRARQGTA